MHAFELWLLVYARTCVLELCNKAPRAEGQQWARSGGGGAPEAPIRGGRRPADPVPAVERHRSGAHHPPREHLIAPPFLLD